MLKFENGTEVVVPAEEVVLAVGNAMYLLAEIEQMRWTSWDEMVDCIIEKLPAGIVFLSVHFIRVFCEGGETRLFTVDKDTRMSLIASKSDVYCSAIRSGKSFRVEFYIG
jgi:hypothetical protein